jgi:gliding motility-associated-like protein
MKLYALFCLISLNINAQTIKEYELCNDYLTKEIRAVTTGAAVSWDVTPFVPYQLSNNVMTITFNSTGTYIISADFRVGDCYKEDKIIIIIKECTQTFIYFPNSFTPDGDNTNESFGPKGINVYDFKMYVFNRWGQLIFTAKDISDRWDGYYKSELCQNDIYVYKAFYKDKRGKEYNKIGKIALIK